MSWIPEPNRCAVAVSVACGIWSEEIADYLGRLMDGAEQVGVSAQLFATPEFCAQSGGRLTDWAGRGHRVDAAVSEAVSLSDAPVEHVLDDLQAACEALPGAGSGVRAYAMTRLGIQKREDLQQALVCAGFEYISSDYSTKLPDRPGNPGFADKNAAMLIKHSQPRRYPGGILEIPAAGYSAHDFLIGQKRDLEAWLEHVRQCIDFAYDLGGLMYAPHLQLDALAAGDPEALTIPAIAAHARSKKLGPVAVCSPADIHRWVAAGEE